MIVICPLIGDLYYRQGDELIKWGVADSIKLFTTTLIPTAFPTLFEYLTSKGSNLETDPNVKKVLAELLATLPDAVTLHGTHDYFPKDMQ